MELSLTRMHGGKPWMTAFDNPFVQAAGRAIEKGFGKTPVFNREGGSIPVVATFREELGLPCVLFGVGLPTRTRTLGREARSRGTSTTASSRQRSLRRDRAAAAPDGPRERRRIGPSFLPFTGSTQGRSSAPAGLFLSSSGSAVGSRRSRRDLAWTALRKIPALTPDAMFLAPVKELGDAVGLTGVARRYTDATAGVVETFEAAA